MDTNTIFHYPDSLPVLGDAETDFEPEWAAVEESSYDLDGCSVPVTAHEVHMVAERLDSEGQRTVITESMSVTASDEEKLQLLNKNTDLRRLNAELMKLNQEWDEIYRRTTESLQHTARALQDEVQSLRQHRDKLSVKLEHEQNKKEFYENSLLQEMKRNQKLQDYIRQLESALHYNKLPHRGVHSATDISRDCSQSDLAHSSPSVFIPQPLTFKRSPSHPGETTGNISKNHKSTQSPRSSPNTTRSLQCTQGKNLDLAEKDQDVNQLKDQLQALKCQTEMYAADYKNEHTDRQRMKTENEKLRRREREMREQMMILQEQLKIYEDDFQKERSDKQVLQRLLKTRTSAHEPILVHRCNNVSHKKEPQMGNDTPAVNRGRSREQQGSDREAAPSPYYIGY
ncbi:uncharacterized protein WCC33_014646 [Rhinophrynus dorsalis]